VRYLMADLLALLLFSVSGAAFHGAELGAELVARTSLPLALSWLAVAALVGTYRAASWKTLTVTWITAVPVGLLLRQLLLGRLASPATVQFLVVGTLTSGAVLLLVRLALHGVLRGRSREGAG